MSDKFWLVWCESHGMPRVKQDTRQDAVNEARRLAQHHVGNAFHVMEVIESIQCVNLVTTKYNRDDDGIPF